MFSYAWLIIIGIAVVTALIRGLWPSKRKLEADRVAPVAGLAPSASASATPAAVHPQSASACDVACAHIADVLNAAGARLPVYADTPIEIPAELVPEGWWGEDSQPGDLWPAPPPELYARFVELKGQSAVAACASVRALLDESGVSYGKAAVEAAAEGRERDVTFNRSICAASLPTVSEDGCDALIAWSFQHGGLSGRGSLSWLKRTADGQWRQHSATMLWIS